MKRNILYGLLMLMALPVTVSAQDIIGDEEQEVVVKKPVKKATQKKYETRIVKGRVTDAATGAPLSGAIVKAMGINGYSVLTDDNGNYELKAPKFSSAILITYPGYNSISQGLSAGEKQEEAKLYSSLFAEAVATDKENIMGDVSANDFKYSNAINIKEEIQKQMGAYAYTTQRSGTPGIGSTMFVQGLNSLNVNAQPLVVLDGVVLDQQYNRGVVHEGFFNDILSGINPADIQDVKILRNGTALYGARGANGVIEITTRRAKAMKTIITASLSAGVTFEPKMYNVMDADQYRGYASELLKTTGTTIKSFKFLNEDPTYYYYKQYHNKTNWNDLVYRTAMTQNYGINIEGGDDAAMYSLSVGYTSAQSPLKCNDMGRLNVRFNTDINLWQNISVKFDASFSNTTRDIRNDGAPAQYDEGTSTAPSFLGYVKSPFLSQYSFGNGRLSDTQFDIEDESYLDEALAAYKNYNWRLANPVALNDRSENEIKNSFENSLLNIAITPKWDILRNLSLSTHFSYTLLNISNKYYSAVDGVPAFYVKSVSGTRENMISSQAATQNSIQSDTRINWNQRYDAHNVSVFGGLRINFENYTTNTLLAYNPKDGGSDKTPFIHLATSNQQNLGVDESWRNMDFYVQGNYDYLGRYFAQLNLTASGSSRFGKDAKGGLGLFGVKWAIFPSVQASWVITNEPWFPRTQGINYLRLNAGFDISGNDDIDVFAGRTYFQSQRYLNTVSGLSLNGIGNTNIKWETTRRFNIGIDTRLANNRIGVSFNYFKSSTLDLLALQTLSFLTGMKENWTNCGRLSNTGFDLAVNGKIIATKDWTWQLGASMGHYQNKVVSLGLKDGQKEIITNVGNANILTREGSAANLFYGYRTKGVFASSIDAQNSGLYVLNQNGVDHDMFGAGDIIFDDVNGDKEINEKDMVVIGDPNPDFYGNIFTSLSWKNIKLDINFTYSVGNDAFNYMRSQLEGGNRFMNQTTALTQRWMVEGQQTNVPKITFQDPMGNARFSDRWIEDASYLKLKSITLSYNLPLNTGFLQGLEFWIQGNNLFTITKYLGTDPEFSYTNSVLGQGIDFGRIGSSRSVIGGIKIKL